MITYHYDVHSEVGKLAQKTGEDKLILLSKIINRSFIFIDDNKEKDITPLSFDGFICNRNRVIALFDVRTRKASVYGDGILFRNKKYPTYMISKKKLDKCVEYSKYLNLPFALCVYFENNDSFLLYRILDKRGKFLINFNVEKTKSQYSVNGGIAYRENAYINVSDGKIIKL